MKIKLSTSESKKPVKIIDCFTESRELVNQPFGGKGTSREVLLIETECIGRFFLCLKNIVIDDGGVIIISSAKGKAFCSITSHELKKGTVDSYTVPLWGALSEQYPVTTMPGIHLLLNPLLTMKRQVNIYLIVLTVRKEAFA